MYEWSILNMDDLTEEDIQEMEAQQEYEQTVAQWEQWEEEHGSK